MVIRAVVKNMPKAYLNAKEKSSCALLSCFYKWVKM